MVIAVGWQQQTSPPRYLAGGAGASPASWPRQRTEMRELSPHGQPRHALRSMLPALWKAVLLVTGTLFALNVTPALAHAAPAAADRYAAAAPANTAVTTFKNDIQRDGQ